VTAAFAFLAIGVDTFDVIFIPPILRELITDLFIAGTVNQKTQYKQRDSQANLLLLTARHSPQHVTVHFSRLFSSFQAVKSEIARFLNIILIHFNRW
jgi:hypothetical protein